MSVNLTNSHILYKQNTFSNNVQSTSFAKIITFNFSQLENGLYELVVYKLNSPLFMTVYIHKSSTNYLYKIIQIYGFNASLPDEPEPVSTDYIQINAITAEQIYYTLRKL